MSKGRRYALIAAFGVLLAGYAISSRYHDWVLHQKVKRQELHDLVEYVAERGEQGEPPLPALEFFGLPNDDPMFRYLRAKDKYDTYVKTLSVRRRGNEYDIFLTNESEGTNFCFLADRDMQLIKAARQRDGGSYEPVGAERRFANELTYWRLWWDQKQAANNSQQHSEPPASGDKPER